jgi:hypothetical protein
VEGPTEFGELFFDVGEGVGEGSAAVGAGGSLGEDALALKLEGLAFALALGFLSVGTDDGGLRYRLVKALGMLLGLICLMLCVSSSLLFFDGFALPTISHPPILTLWS